MELKKFDFKGNDVRVTIGADGEPRWVASDVSKVLGIGRTHDMIRNLERVSDSLCAGAWFTSSPRIGRGKPRLVG